MKKVRILLAAVLAVALLSSVMFFTEAEQVAEENWQADLLKLMDPEDVPSTTQIDYQNTYEAGVEVETHDIACEVTVNGVAYGCEFVFEVAGETVSDWSSVQDWLGHIVTASASTAGSDSEALAKAIDKAIAQERAQAQPDEAGELPLYASEALKLKTIRVSTPFYPELSVDKNGEATKRLQERLIELGFLTGSADGYFGQQTKAAVEALESYIRELEQDLIDERASLASVVHPTQQPVSVEETVSAENVISESTILESRHELTLQPKTVAQAPVETAPVAPTSEPMDVVVDQVKTEPVTVVDGVADALLQAYIYSDAYQAARREIKLDDSGDDVTRLQNRLLNLGYMTGSADGNYGADTARGVRIFQYYNELDQTGTADLQTQQLIFSSQAKAPDNPILSRGSSGEAVRTLQTRLRELGFSKVGTDGDYGDGTVAGVQALQEYVRGIEENWLREQDAAITADADLSEQLTVEVNGVADPLLLDVFYSDSFPAIPAEMQQGAQGDDVTRLQRRLNGLEYLDVEPTGNYGEKTKTAVENFQKRNGLTQTGIADQATMSILFSGEAKKALKPYMLKVSTSDQRVYAYGLDANNEYTELVRTMKCSTGKNATPTPKGTYTSTTGPGARWHYFKKYKCWAQYAYYIEGDILFHSVLYNKKDGPVTQSSVNNLGRKASHGCVRLSVEDAKWIWENCPKGTTVVVY